MNGLDVAILVVAGLGVLWGLRRGVLRMVTSIVALVAAIYLAATYYPTVRDLALKYLGIRPAVAAVIGYVVVFLAVFIVVGMAGNILVRLVQTVNLGWADRLLGGVAGGAIAIAIAGMALMVLTAMLPEDAPLLKQSRLTPQVLSYTDELLNYIPPEVKTIYDRKRRELTRYWLERNLESGSPTASATP
jgi:membrane protein required for colicin V production